MIDLTELRNNLLDNDLTAEIKFADGKVTVFFWCRRAMEGKYVEGVDNIYASIENLPAILKEIQNKANDELNKAKETITKRGGKVIMPDIDKDTDEDIAKEAV